MQHRSWGRGCRGRGCASVSRQIDVATHAGYLGGLEATSKSGNRAPYYCTSATEVIYHVATWMPTDPTDPQQVKKVC